MFKFLWSPFKRLIDERKKRKQIDKELNEYFATEIRNIKENHNDV